MSTFVSVIFVINIELRWTKSHLMVRNLVSRRNKWTSLLIINDHPESGPVTKSFDGHYYVCKTWKQIIKNGKTPSCNEKEFKFLVPKLPADLIAKHGHLNRLETHTLKRVIPFM